MHLDELVGRQQRLAFLGALFVVSAAAVTLYQPWRTVPFPLTDFGEFLPDLWRNPTIESRFAALSTHYLAEGRFFPVTLMSLATRWEMFGWATNWWQASTFLLMAGISAACYALARRIGLSASASLVGASTMVFSSAVSELWIYPQLSEPFGIAFLLAAACLALRSSKGHFAWTIAGLSVLSTAMVWSKETFIGCLPFILILLIYDRSRKGMPFGKTLLGAVCLGLVVGALTILPILLLRNSAEASGYALGYGSALSSHRLVELARDMFLPSGSNTGRVLWLVVVAIGIGSQIRRGGTNGNQLATVSTALTLPLGMTLIYWPWPRQSTYYPAASSLAAVLILAFALDAPFWRKPTRRLLAALAIGVAFVQDAKAAFRLTGEYMASREVIGETALLVAEKGRDALVVIPGSSALYEKGWFEDRFARYVYSLTSTKVHDVRDATCAEAIELLRAPRSDRVVVLFEWRCPWPNQVATPSRLVESQFRRLELRRARLVRETLRVGLWWRDNAAPLRM